MKISFRLILQRDEDMMTSSSLTRQLVTQASADGEYRVHDQREVGDLPTRTDVADDDDDDDDYGERWERGKKA